jgi:ATP adenylyltransferase
MEYIKRNCADGGCVFCGIKEIPEGQRLVVAKGRTCFVIMNAFPYNPMHVMVPPYRHVADFTSLTDEELGEIMTMAKRAVCVINRVVHPDGYNMGMNLGRTAGAGIDQHLHYHIVPRWNGDTNFMPVIGETKTIPQALEESYQILRVEWNREA